MYRCSARPIHSRCNRSEFPTGSKLLEAMAAAAMTGFIHPTAANGTASRLYPKAQARLS
jgi:hypothetical protein